MIKSQWEENIILCDADFLDRTVFNLTVNFERMIARRIPRANLPHWLDCIALDGGLRPSDNRIQAIFIHSAGKDKFENLTPDDFHADLDGKAFRDNLGEFTMHSFQVEEVTTPADFFIECMQTLANAKEVKRLMVIGDTEQYGSRLHDICSQNNGKDITIFSMQPMTGRGFQQELLGYSLMSALGIRGDELT